MFEPAIILTLLFEGLSNGAIYAFMALGIVVLYSVTGVVNVAQGEFAMLSALTLASLRSAELPGTVYIVMAGLVTWGIFDALAGFREGHWQRGLRRLAILTAAAALLYGGAQLLVRPGLPYALLVVVALALVTLLGTVCYRVIVQPLPRASVLVFLILTLGLHLALAGLGLAFWGPEAYSLPAIRKGGQMFGSVFTTYQSLYVIGVALVTMLALYLFLNRTMRGKALRAAAVNRLGARLVGVSPKRAGALSFTISAFLSAVAGILITPITKMAYDMGFLMGLKGFVGAVIGGLVNPALAALGGLFVGVAEQFSAFYISSAYKDALVFVLLIPVLLLLSLRHHDFEEHVDD